MTSPLRRHRFGLAFLALVVAMLFLQPLIRQEVFTLRDHFDYFQPLRWFTAGELREGRLPLWNPYNASGEPWLANPQTGVFYPPTWLFVLLPFATAYMLFLLLHLVVLGWGAYLFFARRASPGAALVGAVALTFSGPVLSLLDVSNNLATFAWIPAALWCAAEGAWRRGGLALALAFLGGEPFFAAVGALLYVVIGLARSRLRGVAWSRSIRAVALAAVAAFGVSAVQLLPFLDMVRDSDRATRLDTAQILQHSVPPSDWLRIATPPPPGAVADPRLGQQFIPNVYAGISVVVLAFAGIATIRRRPELAGWIVLFACAAFVAAGPALIARLPITLFRYPARLIPLAMLAVAALAVAGWDRIRIDRRWLDLVVVLVVLLDLVPRVRPLLATAPFSTNVVPYDRSVGEMAKIFRAGEIDPSERRAWIAGYLNLYDRRLDASTAAPLASAAYVDFHGEIASAPTPEKLGAAAIGYILASSTLPRPFVPVARAGSVVVFRHPETVPVAAHFSRDPPLARIARWELGTSTARVTVTARRPGILVLRQQAARGWSVTVNGKPAKPVTADGVFRGVELGPGRQEVVWSYRAPWLATGSAMTIITLLTMQLSLFVKRTSHSSA